MRRLRVGLLGAGHIGRRFHLPILASMRDAELVAVADPLPEAREACRSLAPRARWFESAAALLDASALDAIVIALPPALHAEATLAGFARGLHVYVEKPLATTLDDGKRMLEAWRRAGTIGMIGFNHRFHPAVRAAKAALARGSIGEVRTIRSTFGAAQRALPEWRRERASGGGALLDLAGHHVDLTRFLLDAEVVEVSAQVRSVQSDGDAAVAALRLSTGSFHSLCASMTSVVEDRFEIDGSRGQLVIDRYRSSRLAWRPGQRDLRRRARMRASVGALVRSPVALRDVLFPPRDRTFALALEAFVEAIRGGTPPSPDLDDGMASLAVVLAAERSAREGIRVAP